MCPELDLDDASRWCINISGGKSSLISINMFFMNIQNEDVVNFQTTGADLV